jgi:hypothetical protein
MRKLSNVARVALAVALGSLWSLVLFRGFGTLAIAPGVALAALILLRPLKAIVGDLSVGIQSLQKKRPREGPEPIGLKEID